jgi:hypothetical protein
LILRDSPPTHLIEFETSEIETPPGISKRRHCSSSMRINREPLLQLSKLISCVKSKPNPSVFIALCAASKPETFGLCLGVLRGKKGKVKEGRGGEGKGGKG